MMAPSSIQLSRERVMDYTYPYYFDTSNFLIRKPDPDSDKWRVYIDPFHWHVYVSIATVLPATATILYLIEKYNPYYHINAENPHSFLYLSGGERPPVSQSARALISTWWIFSIVIVATYSGNLIAFLTVSKDKVPITTLEELGLQSKYKWGTIGGSYFITFFERSTLPSYRRIWNGLEQANKTDPDVTHLDPDVHIQKVRTEDYVYIGDKISMSARVSNDCSLVISTEEIPNMNYGVGLPNNSLFTETFSNKQVLIMELMESGIFQIWMYKHWPPKTFCKGEITTEAKKIRIVDVQSAFYLIAIGIVIGSFVLISEVGFSKCRFYSKNNKRQQKIKSNKSTRKDFIEQTYESTIVGRRHNDVKL
ncbi:hypothetical protein KUTeg_007459 [Tegillarca granosa]|uniref:Ionotropic glutamate receptor C-terminal domain-containing protein n=1 Tax=Tegillarca granosa TaxID=220873 RepID=A0ABQ9FDB8_TEGGR|nr:hypothetical protein KUTeg_007459 [Tegillarca granosa]